MKRALIIIVILAAIGGGAWTLMRRNGDEQQIEFRYAKAERTELVRSISATGLLVAKTTVDVKSKAGGKVVQLAVDEGSEVKAGDIIARIDPEDTRAIYEQAQADVTSATARAEQARYNAELQARSSDTSVRDAQVALELARIRYEKMRQEMERQPQLTQSAMRNAEAALRTQQEAMRQLESVTIPQRRRDAEAALRRSRVERDNAQAELQRQRELLDKGFVAQSAVDRAQTSYEAARANFETAEQRLSTLDQDISAEVQTQRARLEQAQAALDQARANRSQDVITAKSLEEARQAIRQAEINLKRAQDERISINARRAEVRNAQASTVRSRVSMRNARVQLDSTTVVAPRDGVVTVKYLEEGTIIPPGTSTFAQGTSIVQISDTTSMYVETAVNEADIAQVKEGQKVRVIVEAYPSARIQGVVDRVNPSARTEANITAIEVRVRILPGSEVRLLPGMTATCEFLTLEKPNVLTVPSQAIKRDQNGTYVQVKGPGGKPVRRDVKTGEMGNDGVEVLEGLQEGEEVVVAEINIAQMREIQRRMLEAQQGGGLTGGPPRGMGGGGGGRPTGGGGGRPGGGGGGGR